jgi:hypothetical protein
MAKSGWEMLWRIMDTKAVYLVIKLIYSVGRKFYPDEYKEVD